MTETETSGASSEANAANTNAGTASESTTPTRRRRSGKTETVTYLPREGDNPKTTWDGLTFHANVPKEVSLDTHAKLVESAKNNKFFKVGSFDPDKDTVAAEETFQPKTAEQYRVHCIAWLNKCESDTDFVDRWMAEEKLREECGVGTDDIDYLNTLITPKRAELKKRALGE